MIIFFVLLQSRTKASMGTQPPLPRGFGPLGPKGWQARTQGGGRAVVLLSPQYFKE